MQQDSGNINNTKRGLENMSFLRQDQLATGLHFDWLRCTDRLNKNDCNEIVSTCSEFPLVPPYTVGGEGRYSDHRQADVRMVSLNTKTKWIIKLIRDVAIAATKDGAGLDLTEISREPQYVEYRPGWGHFNWHNDYSHGLPEAPRKLTIIIQLSSPDQYEGGALQIFGTNEIEQLPQELGTVVSFPSLLLHRVTPVTKGLRRALVAWIAGPRIK